MMHDQAAQMRGLGMIFPYAALWEWNPEASVSLAEILAREPAYEAHFTAMAHLGEGKLAVSKDAIAALVAGLGLPDAQSAQLSTQRSPSLRGGRTYPAARRGDQAAQRHGA